MATVTPYLIVRDAEKAIAFYQRAFGAREQYRLVAPGDGRIGHAELQIGDSVVFLADEWPDFGALSPLTIGGTPISLHLLVDDVDAVVRRAEAEGATVLRPVKDEFFGERTGMVADPFGHRWHVATHVRDVSPEDMQKQWNATAAG